MDRRATSSKGKVNTKRPSRVHDLEKRLAESLEREKATAEILGLISRSPTDAQPVFRTILTNANTLCGASFSVLWLWDGDALIAVAHENVSPTLAETLRTARAQPHRRNPLGLSITELTVVHVADVLGDPRFTPEDVPTYRLEGARSILCVPMIREGSLVGVINLWRREPRAFTDGQIALVRTFADQAVIAIENVRLFTELKQRNAEVTEALEQQTATSEILRVISSSPTDVQPVFDAIAEAAMRLCGAHSSLVTTFDGELLHLVAQADISPEGREVVRDVYPRRPNRGFASGRSVLTRAIVQIPDLTEDEEFDVQVGAFVARTRDFRSILAVPMLRDGLPIGTINAHKAQPGPFTDKQVALLQTFADQAVIAVENVRLFKELEEKNRALTAAHAQVTEALEQQTATSELLKVIGRSTFDLQPVFETLAENGVRLCGAERALIERFDGRVLRLVAGHNVSPELRAFIEHNPIAPGRDSA